MGWVIHHYEHGLPGGPVNAMGLPTHDSETVHIDAMP